MDASWDGTPAALGSAPSCIVSQQSGAWTAGSPLASPTDGDAQQVCETMAFIIGQ